AVRWMFAGVMFGDIDVAGERRAAERTQIDVDHDVIGDAGGTRDTAGGFYFDLVPLAVAERHRVRVVAVALCHRERGGGIDAPAQQHDRAIHCSACARSSMRSSECSSPT